jgi:4-aminobutyrate aminotransferase/(S)-3-amino-2-methylpropionate transaminase
LLARRAAAAPAGLGRATDVVVERADGGLVFDVDGNTLIDLAGGLGMLAAGHCPPAVVKAIQDQAAKYIHPCALVTTYEPFVRLAELLNEITPGTFPKKTIFANSGAEAVENAVKLSRKFTGRPAIVCFEGGYHGRTLLTLSLTSKYGLFKSGFGPFAPEIVRLPVPDVYRTPAGMSATQYLDYAIHELEKALVAQIDPKAVAAMIIEPVQGEAGFVPIPPRFLTRIRELCTEHGIVMIADEVQCGMGRTGRLFAIEHYGLVPDLITMAKSLGGGMPIAAVTGRAEIMDSAHLGGVGSTYGGGPVVCAAAIETLNIIRQPAFLAQGRRLGDVMRGHGTIMATSASSDIRELGPDARRVRPRSRVEEPRRLNKCCNRPPRRRRASCDRAGLLRNCVRLLRAHDAGNCSEARRARARDRVRSIATRALRRDLERRRRHPSSTACWHKRRCAASAVLVRGGRIAAVGIRRSARGSR